MPCQKHTAHIYDRGGRSRFLSLDPVEAVDWERVGDDMSLANVSVSASRCGGDLSLVEAARHELVVFRGSQRVWEGPITLVTYEGDRVEIQARDVMHYTNRTIMRAGYDNSYPNVDTCINRSMDILTGELGRAWETLDPPINVVEYLTPIRRDGDSRTARRTVRFEKTVFDDIDDMARRSGMDYTVVGRRIILHDTDTALGRTPVLSEADVAGDVRVTQYGMETAAFAAVTGANGMYGTAEGPNGFPDPYYGAWEILDDAYDEEEGSDQPTQNELHSQAQRNVADRIPTPIEVRVTSNATLAASSPIADVDLLVPGVQVPVLANFAARRLTQMQKLRRVKFAEDSSGETIQITLTPTNSVLDEGEGG